jgi:hypothetical protein
LVDELNERSDVPKRVAQQWIDTEQILPLLDGLDEVAVEHRKACAEAINNFRRDHGLLPIAVCSRIGDYEVLGTKLRLRSAVVVQPLTRVEVQEYLERIEESAYKSRAALKEDPSFWELLDTPLMLWVAMLAYRDAPVELSREETLEQRRRRLFASFIDAMFKRRSPETRYSRRQTLSWLGSLARALTRAKQTVFYLESLREESLPTLRERWLSRTGIVLACTGLGGLIGEVIDWGYRQTYFALPIGLVIGLAGNMKRFSAPLPARLTHRISLIGTFTKLQPVEILRYSLTDARHRIAKAMRDGLIVGVIVGAIFGVIAGLRLALIFGVIFGVGYGLSAGVAVGVCVGLLTLTTTEVVESSRAPNQGTRDSIKNAFLGLAIVGLSVGLFGGLSFGVIVELSDGTSESYSALIFGLVSGIIAGLIGGLMGGWLFAIRHFVLRVALWIRGCAPLNYVPFLDYAAERLFLRKVGGGYIFLHRMLLEYFATLEEPSGRPDPDLRASAR